MNDKFTINYGVRLESETGLIERNDFATVGFDRSAVSPLNSRVNVIDPVDRCAPRHPRRPGVRRRQRRADASRATSRRSRPRRASAWSTASSPKTVLRGGWGLYYAPWNYAAAGTDGWGQIGYSATTQIEQPADRGLDPDDDDRQSVPERARAAERQHARSADRRRRRSALRRRDQGRAARAAVLDGPAARAAVRHQRVGGLHRPDRLEPELGRIRQRADQHQPARSEVPGHRAATTRSSRSRIRSSASPKRASFATRAHGRARPVAASVSAVRQRR